MVENTRSTPETAFILYAVGSSFVADVEAIIDRLGAKVHAYVVNNDRAPALQRAAVSPRALTDGSRQLPVVVPLVTPGHRHAVSRELDDEHLINRPPLVDPTAIISRSVSIGDGAIVNAGTVIGGEASVGAFSVVNRSASVGHHARLADFTTIGPGATLAADVVVERGAFVATGAVILPGCTIGTNAVVSGGAVVGRDVPPNTLVIGNPARVLRSDVAGYNGVGVP